MYLDGFKNHIVVSMFTPDQFHRLTLFLKRHVNKAEKNYGLISYAAESCQSWEERAGQALALLK